MLTSCSHLLLPKKVQSILTVSPVRIGRLQQKCISICYSKKKKDLFLSVRFCLEGAKIAESEERDYLQSREKEKKIKKAVSLPGKKDFRWEDTAGSSCTSQILWLLLRMLEAPCPHQVPGTPRLQACCPRNRCFFGAKTDTGLLFWKCYGVAALAAGGKAWELGTAKPSFLLGICRQHVLGAGAVQQLGHRAWLTGKGREGQLCPPWTSHPGEGSLSHPQQMAVGILPHRPVLSRQTCCFWGSCFPFSTPQSCGWSVFLAGVWLQWEETTQWIRRML